MENRIDHIQLQSGKTMTIQRVTIELPEPVFRQLARIAEATQQFTVGIALSSAIIYTMY